MRRTIIEFGNTTVKVLQASGGTPAAPVLFAQVVPSGGYNNPADLSHQLAAIFKKARLDVQRTDITMVVGRQHAILRHFNLPSQSDDELNAMVELQAVNHIPYGREDMILDFLVIEKKVEGYSKVLAAAVPRDIIMQYLKILTGAGIAPHKITLTSVGLWLWASGRIRRPQSVIAVVDLDEGACEVCLCGKDRLLTSRYFAQGPNGLGGNGKEHFLKQLELTIASYNKEKLGPPIEHIMIVSAAGENGSLRETLAKEYNMQVEDVRPASDAAYKSLRWPKAGSAQGVSMTAIMGIMYAPQGELLDLVPGDLKESRIKAAGRKSMVRLVVWGLGALTAVGLVLSMGLIKNSAQLNRLDHEVAVTKTKVAYVNKRTERVKELKAALDRRVVFADVVDSLYRFLPRRTSVTNLSINGDMLSMQGFSPIAGDINQIQNAMVDNPLFDEVSLDYVNKRSVQNGEMNYFKITCRVVTKAGKP